MYIHTTRLEKITNKWEKLKKQCKHGETMKDTLNQDVLEDKFPPSPSPNIKTNDVVYTIIEAEDAISGHFDLTSRFPQRSSRGNQYLMAGYHYDANSILGITIKIE